MDEDTIKLAAKFDGTDKYDYENYCLRTLALGGMKGGWNRAYLQTLPIAANATATANNPVVTQDEAEENIKLNRIAWNYLVLSLDGTARSIVMGVLNDDPRAAWLALENRYKPRSIEAYTKLCIDFEKCVMERPTQDPETWIMALHKLNSRMGEINAQYRKSDTVMISHVLSKLPEEYGMFSTGVTLVGYSQLTFEQFRSRVHDFWEMRIKGKDIADSNQAFNTNQVSKTNNNRNQNQAQNQVYTGFAQCGNCGKRGHKAEDCWQEGGGKAGQFPNRNNSNVTCYKCGQKGHFARICGKNQAQDKTGNTTGNNMNGSANENQGNNGNSNNHASDSTNNEALNSLFVAKEETSLFCGIIEHKPFKHLMQPSYSSKPIRRWWADECEDSDDEDEDIDCFVHESSSPENVLIMEAQPFQEMFVGTCHNDDEDVDEETDSQDHEKAAGDEEKDDGDDEDHTDSSSNSGWEEYVRQRNLRQLYERANMLRAHVVGDEDNESFSPDVSDAEWERNAMNPEPLYEISTTDTSAEQMESADSKDSVEEEEEQKILVAQEITDMSIDNKISVINEEKCDMADKNPDDDDYIMGDEEIYAEYLLNSGATCHITNDKKSLSNITRDGTKITVGNNAQCVAECSGSIYLQIKYLPSRYVLELHKVFYVPSFGKKIISVPQLTREGYSLTFRERFCDMHLRNGGMLTISHNRDGMYYIYGKHLPESTVLSLWRADANLILLPGTDPNEHVPQVPNELFLDESVQQVCNKVIDINEAHDKMGHISYEQIKRTLRLQGYDVRGEIKVCEACKLAKARRKNVSKTTHTKAEEPGHRMFIDISGPFTPSIGGAKFWLQIVDDYSKMGFCFFMKSKTEIGQYALKYIQEVKKLSHKVKFIRCDGAGENRKYLQDVADDQGAVMEFASPDTPQFNGVVERRFATLKLRSQAMLNNAQLTKGAKEKLWAEAVNCANDLENIVLNRSRDMTPYELFTGRKSKLYDNLIEFGRVGFVTIREEFHRNWTNRSFKAIMTGYAKNHSVDTYRFYNPTTKAIFFSRDVAWSDWSRLNVTRDIDIFEGNAHDLDDHTEGIEEIDVFGVDTRVARPPNSMQQQGGPNPMQQRGGPIPIQQQGGQTIQRNPIILSPSKRIRSSQRLADAQDKVRALKAEMKRLQTFYNPTTGVNITMFNPESNEYEDEEYTFASELTSDPNEPKAIEEALSGPEAEAWRQSAIAEIENFRSRQSWIPVSRSVPKNMNKKIIKSKWVFKKKSEQDGSTRFKSRVVSKGYMQIPGVDYSESFSPVASSSSIRVIFAVALYNTEEGWELHLIDVEAAFLEGSLGGPTFMEWPPGMVLLGLITEEQRKEECLQMLKCIYGNVDAALRFYEEYKAHLKQMGLVCSLTDPCVFYLRDQETNKLRLVIAVHVDDTIIAGKPEDIRWFKDQLQQRFKIKDLGSLKKHLGIWYSWEDDDHGERMLVATMPDLIQEIIHTTEKHAGKEIREYNTPGIPNESLLRHEDEPELDAGMYRSIVGKIIYLTSKIMIEGCNASREMAKFFSRPTSSHWHALHRFVGYLKKEKDNIKLTYRKPHDLRCVIMVDSNYAMNKDDRRSVSGAIHTVGRTITNWCSKTQKNVTLSSTEAEYCALALGAQELRFTQQLLEEIEHHVNPGVIFEDNTGAIYLVRNSQVGQRTKHIDIRHHFLRELHGEGKLRVKFVNTEFNEADVCTKNVSEALQSSHRDNIRMGRLNVWKYYKTRVLEASREDEVKQIFETSTTFNDVDTSAVNTGTFVGYASNIPGSDDDDQEEDEEYVQEEDQNEEDVQDNELPALEDMIPANIIPPDNIQDTINVLGLLNALHHHYLHEHGGELLDNEDEDSEDDNWDSDDSDDHNSLIQNQLRTRLEQQRQQNQNGDQDKDEDKPSDDERNSVNFASLLTPIDSDFEAMWEDDKDTRLGSCYIAPKSEMVFKCEEEENWFGVSNTYACSTNSSGHQQYSNLNQVNTRNT